MKWVICSLFAVFAIFMLQTGATNQISALETLDPIRPTIITQGDIYKISYLPTLVSFSVKAIDNIDGQIPVQCDRQTGSIFKLGKTTVRCMATDSSGNEARASFVVTVGYDVVKIPSWLKQTTGYWINQQISDKEFTITLEYLFEKQIIQIPYSKQSKDQHVPEIPVWIKTNSQKWIDGNISDDEFSIGIQWMLEKKLINA